MRCVGGRPPSLSSFQASIDSADTHTPQVGERWYTDNTCSRLCTCSIHNNISCLQTACKPGQMCWPRDGLMRCRGAGRRPTERGGGPSATRTAPPSRRAPRGSLMAPMAVVSLRYYKSLPGRVAPAPRPWVLTLFFVPFPSEAPSPPLPFLEGGEKACSC